MRNREDTEAFAAQVQQLLGELARDVHIERDEVAVSVLRTRIVEAMTVLRDAPGLGLAQLMDIAGVDYPERLERFEIVYHLLSLRHNRRLQVRVATDETSPVPSVTDVFPSAGWFEREVWDLFGVLFSGHPDLRRILTDYGFDGHPLRKDFPLTGFAEVRYDPGLRRVVYEPVTLTQDYRAFDFLSPWEGMTDVQKKRGAV